MDERATAKASKRYSQNDSRSTMFVVELNYKVDLATIDAHMREHMRFLDRYYASGNFVASGRKVPRDGGIILAVADSRTEMERIVREDPFCAGGLADFRIVEFRLSQQAASAPQKP